MLQVLMACFLSFTIAVAPCTEQVAAYAVNDRASTMSENSTYSIEDISYDAYEVEWYWNWLVGRHSMIQITGVENLGVEMIDTITSYYDASVLTDFTFTETITTVTTTTLSTTESVSSKVGTSLKVVAGIPGATVSDSVSVEQVYTIQNTATYTATVSRTMQVTYSLREEVVEGKVFALCMAANTYKVTWKSWLWDDYWYGAVIVDGTTKTHTAYITVDPYVTIYIRGEGVYSA